MTRGTEISTVFKRQECPESRNFPLWRLQALLLSASKDMHLGLGVMATVMAA